MSTSPRSLAGGGLARQTSASSVFSSSHSQSAARHEVHQHTRVADASKLDHLLRLPRRTPSVRSALERTAASAVVAADGGGGGGGGGGELDADAVLQRLFARLALSVGALEGGVVRALVHERMAILARVHAETGRLEAAAAAGAQPGAGAHAELLGYLRAAAAANARELRRRGGAPAAEEVFAARRTPEVRAAFALAVPSEEAAMAEAEADAAEASGGDAGDGLGGGGAAAGGAGSAAERAARIWRRKLAALASTFKSAGGALTSHGSPRHLTHDSRTHTGHRALHNDLNMKSEKDRMSYFQLAQHKYGKGCVSARPRAPARARANARRGAARRRLDRVCARASTRAVCATLHLAFPPSLNSNRSPPPPPPAAGAARQASRAPGRRCSMRGET